LSKPRLSTVSNVDWTNVQVGAFKATASTARHHQSQSQSQIRNVGGDISARALILGVCSAAPSGIVSRARMSTNLCFDGN